MPTHSEVRSVAIPTPPDADAEHEALQKLDATVGFAEAETVMLLSAHRKLAAAGKTE